MFHVEHNKFGVYVHVPFCVSKCAYCDFYRVVDLGLADAYLDALASEICGSAAAGLRPRTVYVGGGTPSCLGVSGLRKLLRTLRDGFDVGGVAEWTVECNPEDVTDELAGLLAASGVNRVSMGAQSLCDAALRMMGRRHDADRVSLAVGILRDAGIKNISVDCIYGLPAVRGYSAAEDFERFVSLGVEHLSAYSLQYEEGSAFSRMVESGRLTPLPDDEVAEQYDVLTSVMREAGYHHYEISNYAKPGFEAVHNSSYWDRTDYFGFGPSASSLINGRRITNVSDVAEYVATCGGKKELVEDVMADDVVYDEVVMLGLRTSRGVNPADVPASFARMFSMAVKKEVSLGNLVVLDDGCVRIPEERWMVSDSIIRDVAGFSV